ncbi:Crp/Fnr family transcriptional regulator [Mucilaginibacter terrenus]|uniref:Crp/Fnr family transcriptional regulator n=1 Tax=Mucilaginibacter terrenus TaxID=2482727 RepID=A0A3E2NJQ6_9SPHI|nr:Crp/Fnr family transcriptional regulator [Mucilaginibacter terrenus]RFZ81232.1 Crp/Fnr family transcriptional regulator [Mucilaginibacter terrenus]
MPDLENINFPANVFGQLGPADIANLLRITRTRKLAAGEVYIEAGSDSQKLAFINSGLIRVYHLKPNGDDLTLMLRWENQFIASVDGVIYQRPNRFIYQAMEDTELLEMDYYKAEKIIGESLSLSSTKHSVLLHMLGEAMERVESFVLLTAEERYLKLIEEQPTLYNRVPDKYLATLLGITPVSLSRIRKRIAQHPK